LKNCEFSEYRLHSHEGTWVKAVTPQVRIIDLGNGYGLVERVTLGEGVHSILGLDVSKWQGVMNWQISKTAGVRFAIIKMSEYVIDEKFEYNYSETKRLGIKRQPYHFFHPGAIDVNTQINTVLTLLAKYGDPDPISVCDGNGNIISNAKTVWLDCEMSDGKYNDYISSVILSFKNKFKAARPDLQLGIYTSPGWWNYNTLEASYWKTLPLWVANWNVAKPFMPRDWVHYALWQFSGGANGRGKEFGAGGAQSIDLNWYNGGEEQFSGSITPPIPEPPPDPDPVVQTVTVLANGTRIRTSPTTNIPSNIAGAVAKNTILDVAEMATDENGLLWYRIGNLWIASSTVK